MQLASRSAAIVILVWLFACQSSSGDVATKDRPFSRTADACGPCAANEECHEGLCVCRHPSLSCDGTCTDPLTDADHCGACGRTCITGTCVDGYCAEEKLLVRNQTPAQALATDSLHLYWIEGSTLMRATKTGRDLTTLATGLGTVWQFAVHGDSIYWSVGGTAPGIYRLPTSGGQVQQIPTQARIDDLLVDDTGLYWVETDTAPLVASVHHWDPTTGAVTTLHSINGVASEALAKLNDVLYWVAGTTGEHRILSLVPGGGSPDLVHVASWIADLSASPGSLFWIDDGRHITALNLSTSTPRRLSSHRRSPQRLAVLDDRVVWTEDYASLVHLHASGGIPFIAKEQYHRTDVYLAADDRFWYWIQTTAPDELTLYRLERID